jgi:hydrogenase maturation factor
MRARVDRVIVSGTLGDHGVAVMSKRQTLTFDTAVVSESAALHGLGWRLPDWPYASCAT